VVKLENIQGARIKGIKKSRTKTCLLVLGWIFVLFAMLAVMGRDDENDRIVWWMDSIFLLLSQLSHPPQQEGICEWQHVVSSDEKKPLPEKATLAIIV